MRKKKLSLIFLGGFTSIILFGQDKKDLTISFGTGIFNSPYYTNARAFQFYNFDFDYYINERHIISTNFLSGKHRYYDSIHSNNEIPLNTPGYEDHTNATAEYMTFTLLYKYKIVNHKKVSLSLGVGAGIMVQTFQFLYTEGNSEDVRDATWPTIALPVKLEMDYKLSKHFQLGIFSGFFIGPDIPVLGYHLGIRASCVLK